MRRWPPLALACALILHGSALARAYTVDDLLGLEQLGPVRLAPGARWGVIQTFAPWDQAPRYDLDWWSTYGLGRLQRVDLRDGATRPLLPQAPGAGYLAGPFSPSGQKMTVTRLTGHAWELGVVTLATGEVRWLGLSPELALWGRSVAWRDEDELVFIAQPDRPIGHLLGYGWQAQARLGQAWADAAAGRLAVSAMGSGRYLGVRPKAPPKRLVAVRLSSGEVRDLAQGEFIDLEIAPGGRTLAAVANGPDVQSLEGPATTGVLGRQRTLTLVDLERGRAWSPCPDCDLTPRLLIWSASGERLLVHMRKRDRGPSGFHLVEARTGRAAPAPMTGLVPALQEARNKAELAAGAWIGETPIVYARPVGGVRADWYALEAGGPRVLTAELAAPSPRLQAINEAAVTVADGQALWRIPIRDQAVRLAAQSGDVVRIDSPPESERLSVIAPSPTDLLVRGSDRLRPFQRPDGAGVTIGAAETPLAAAADASLAIISQTTPQGTERLILRANRQRDLELAVLNGGLAKVDPAHVRPVRHKGPDGQSLTSWLIMPANLQPGDRAPLIVIPYPGDVFTAAPADQAPGALRLQTNAQVLAGRGYAVLAPSLPYARGREPIEGLAGQVLAAVDAAVDQAPVDAERLAVWGHSYGGYAALALAVQSPRFKAVIASAAPANLASFYGKLSPYSYAVPEAGLPILSTAGWAETGQARMGVPPWQDLERYRRNSPIFFVDQIAAPVMLIHGDLDHGQAQEMFTSLYRRHKDAVLVIYRGETHVILGPGNVRDQYARVFGFLAEHVGAGLGNRPAAPPP